MNQYPFRDFRVATYTEFKFLESPPYNFKIVSETTHPPEATVRYENQTTAVTVSYEFGGAASVVIGRRIANRDWLYDQRIGLKSLLMHRCPENLQALESHIDRTVRAQLADKSLVLREYGADILTGDFTIFPELLELVSQEKRRRNLMMFGSETGETIKVDD